jgi:gliding motility-associated-like protein
MVTSAVTVPANGQLRFYTKTIQTGVQGSLFDIKISTTSQTNPTSFTNLISYDEASLTAVANVYEEKVIDLPATYPAGSTIYIAFVMTNDNGDRWLIDNVNVVPKCNAPIGPLATANETTTSAQLSWGNPGGITAWEVEVVPFANAFTGVPTYTNVTTNPFTATGLLPNTLYKFQVRSVCAFPSDWFGPRSFQTASFGDTCSGPIVVGALPYQTVDNTANYIDLFDTAQPLACSGTATNYMAGNDVFYSYTATFTGNIAISLSPTNVSSSIHVYSACPGTTGATCLAGVANTNSGIRNINPFPVVAGTTYYIIVSSSAAQQTVGYTLTIQQVFCNQPTGLTATSITSTTANLEWAAATGITTWQYSVGAAPYGLPSGTSTLVTTTSNTTNPFTGIPGIVYEYYVRAQCSDGNYSIWAGPFLYTLPQVATPLNFIDGLETLTGWTLNNGTQSNKWSVGSAVNNGGTKSLYITDTNGATNTYNNTAASVVQAYKDFVIPAGATQLDFTFDWRSVGEVQDYIRVWTVPTTFTPTAGTQITAVANSRIKIGPDFTSIPNFTTQNYTLNATPYAGGNMRVVFEWRNNTTVGNQPPAAIDNIKLDYIACPKPLTVSISNINYNNAQVNWTNGATETQWEVLVLPAGSAAPTATSVGIPASTNPFVVSGLTSVTCYDVYVRAVCSSTSVSFWSPVANFCTTPHFCAGDHFYDIGGATGNYTNSQTNVLTTVCPDNAGNVVTVLFNTFNLAAGDNLVIRNGNLITSPILGTYTGTTLPPSFTATNPSGCLSFVFTSNATGVAAGWDATIFCTPPITCPKPTTLTTTSVGTTSVQLGWTEAGTATQWEILVLPLGSPVPNPGTPGTLVTTNPFVWGSLTPGTAYTFFVRAKCSGTDFSFYSNGANFYTKPLNDECSTALSVPVNSDMNCTLVTAGTITGATNSGTPASTCGGTADDDTWFTFTATSNAHIINFNDIVGSTTDLSHAVYSGTCGALTLLYCDVNNFSFNNTFVSGQTYYIRVWSASTTANQTANFNVCINKVGPPILAENSSTTAAPTTYTVQQLVTDVLVTSPCGIVSNITFSTGTNFGQPQNGIGYFNKNGSSFGLDEGIILATRTANTCDGPNDATSEGTGTWAGDAQLLAYMQSLGIDTGLNSYNNSSKIEFDFVPIADQVKFDFIFASDEYGTFQCTYSDAFAFFLTNLATNTTTNLAVIPGVTPPTPIAVTTIRKNEFNSGCTSENPTYFDKFYGTGNPQNGLPDVIAPTNFKGYTVPMSAVGTVIPGQIYHMKFVVGDRNDSAFDSAVFLSKFDIGNVDLGADLTVNGNSALCAGQSYTINSGLTAPPYGFTWYYKAPNTSTFVQIAGQTGATLNVTAPGEYKLVAQYVGSACVGEDTIVVEFYPDLILITPEPNDLSTCSTIPVFDLTQNTPVVTANFSNPSAYQVTYYLTQADAIAASNSIINPNAYVNVSSPQTIWVRIYNTLTFCSGIKSFDIAVLPPPVADISYSSTPYCFNQGTASVTNNGAVGGTYSIVGSPANISVSSAGTISWTNQVAPGNYTVNYQLGSGSCTSSDSFIITIASPFTATFTSSNTTICEGDSTSITISGPAGATLTYNDGSSNQTVVLNASGIGTLNHSGGTKTYSLVSVTSGSCTQALSGSVVITVTSFNFNLTGACEGNQFVIKTDITNSQNYSFEWTNSSNVVIGTNSNSLVIDAPGTYSCAVTNLSGFVCTKQVSKLFDNTFCQIQKGISPNGDGLNDFLELVAKKVEIFNRYGKESYTKENYNNDWRGQFNNGSEMPDGTYYYVIELVSGEKKTGWIYINREQK